MKLAARNYPTQRNVYCDTNGTGVPTHTNAATLCGENTDATYSTCAKLVYRASQFEADAQIGRLLDALDTQVGHATWLQGAQRPPMCRAG